MRDERFHDCLSGGVALDPHDAAFRVRRLARLHEVALEILVEGHAVGEEVARRARRLACHGQHDAALDDAGAGLHRVAVRFRLSPSDSAAAMPPCAQAEEAPWPMGAAASTVTGAARVSAP